MKGKGGKYSADLDKINNLRGLNAKKNPAARKNRGICY